MVFAISSECPATAFQTLVRGFSYFFRQRLTREPGVVVFAALMRYAGLWRKNTARHIRVAASPIRAVNKKLNDRSNTAPLRSSHA
nr:MAG TPA: hypothetical protein [Caudoviricetes sp.]